MKFTREIKTAILVIASIVLFIWGYSFLKGSNILNDHKKLYVEYENVEGLATGAPVTVSGKIIGKVNSINLTKTGKLLIELQINEEDFPISKLSVAQIFIRLSIETDSFFPIFARTLKLMPDASFNSVRFIFLSINNFHSLS